MKRLTTILAIMLAIFLPASPASAGTTECADGTTSQSAGGPGTCSWHGGIASYDYSYSVAPRTMPGYYPTPKEETDIVSETVKFFADNPLLIPPVIWLLVVLFEDRSKVPSKTKR